MMGIMPDQTVIQKGKNNMGVCLLQLLFVLHYIHSCVLYIVLSSYAKIDFMFSKMYRFFCCETRIKVLEYLLLGNWVILLQLVNFLILWLFVVTSMGQYHPKNCVGHWNKN